MPRFGKMAVFHKDIRESGPLARLFVKIMGSPSFTAHNFYLHMKKMLPERSYNTILDAGCGKGDFTFYMAEKYPDSRVEG